MKHVLRAVSVGMKQAASGGPPLQPDAEVLRLRTVHRAAADLRRGTPVLLTGDAPLVVLAAETAGPRGLAEFATLAAEPPVLLLAPVRAAAVLHQPIDGGSVVALAMADELLEPKLLRGLADPTAENLLSAHPEPANRTRWTAEWRVRARRFRICTRWLPPIGGISKRRLSKRCV